jgi:hypothetical protein
MVETKTLNTEEQVINEGGLEGLCLAEQGFNSSNKWL